MNEFRTGLMAIAMLLGMALGSCNKAAQEQASTASTTSVAAAGSSENSTDTVSGIQSASFSVKGMHCTGCSDTIQSTLSKMEGVESCSASFESGEVSVSYDPASISEERLSQEIASLGYKVSMAGTEAAAGDEQAATEAGESGVHDA